MFLFVVLSIAATAFLVAIGLIVPVLFTAVILVGRSCFLVAL